MRKSFGISPGVIEPLLNSPRLARQATILAARIYLSLDIPEDRRTFEGFAATVGSVLFLPIEHSIKLYTMS